MPTRVNLVYTRSGAGAEDVAVTTHDFAPQTDPTTEAQEDDIVTQMHVGFWNSVKTYIANNVVLQELRFYRGYNGDGSPGEVDRVVTVASAGTNTSAMLPPQCSTTITEEITGRTHWGRFYLPGLASDSSVLTDDGRLAAGARAAINDAIAAAYQALNTGNIKPVVWTRIGTDPPSVQEIIATRVDDIIDIQRRRRWQTRTGLSRTLIT